jgi:hypothetical protein
MRLRDIATSLWSLTIAAACGGKSSTEPTGTGVGGSTTDMGTTTTGSTTSTGGTESGSSASISTGTGVSTGSTGSSTIDTGVSGSSGPGWSAVATGSTAGSVTGAGGASGIPREAGASGGLGGSLSYSIVVSPPMSELSSGATEQLSATEFFADGSSYDATAAAKWDVDVPNVVSVAAGHVMAIGPGTTHVIATMGAASGQATVTVPNNKLLSITISPNPATTVVQGTVAFTATGSYSDGTTGNLNTRVKWFIDDPSVASLAANVARGVAPGTTKVHANIGTLWTSEATLTVNDAP